MKSFVSFCILFLLSSTSFADALVDLGFIYSGDRLKASSDDRNTQYFYNFNPMFNLDKSRKWNFGWSFFGLNQNSEVASVKTTYTSSDMGPVLRWNMDRSNIFSMTVGYGFIAKANFKTGTGSSERWEGSSLLGQIAAQAPVGDGRFYVGLSLNYYSANYSKKVIDKVESSNNAQKSWVFPMVQLTWRP